MCPLARVGKFKLSTLITANKRILARILYNRRCVSNHEWYNSGGKRKMWVLHRSQWTSMSSTCWLRLLHFFSCNAVLVWGLLECRVNLTETQHRLGLSRNEWDSDWLSYQSESHSIRRWTVDITHQYRIALTNWPNFSGRNPNLEKRWKTTIPFTYTLHPVIASENFAIDIENAVCQR